MHTYFSEEIIHIFHAPQYKWSLKNQFQFVSCLGLTLKFRDLIGIYMYFCICILVRRPNLYFRLLLGFQIFFFWRLLIPKFMALLIPYFHLMKNPTQKICNHKCLSNFKNLLRLIIYVSLEYRLYTRVYWKKIKKIKSNFTLVVWNQIVPIDTKLIICQRFLQHKYVSMIFFDKTLRMYNVRKYIFNINILSIVQIGNGYSTCHNCFHSVY